MRIPVSRKTRQGKANSKLVSATSTNSTNFVVSANSASTASRSASFTSSTCTKGSCSTVD